MATVRGYHIRWAFIVCIGALVGFIIYRQYYLSTPDGKFELYLDFLKTADSVHIYETTDPWQGVTDPEAKLELPPSLSVADKAAYLQSHVRKDLNFGPTSSQQAVDFLTEIRGNWVRPLGGFQPHHFILASKGTKTIEIDIAFLSGRLRCLGDLPKVELPIRSAVSVDKVTDFFGADIFPQLEQIDRTVKHPAN